jgi:hypothetical protein
LGRSENPLCAHFRSRPANQPLLGPLVTISCPLSPVYGLK